MPIQPCLFFEGRREEWGSHFDTPKTYSALSLSKGHRERPKG